MGFWGFRRPPHLSFRRANWNSADEPPAPGDETISDEAAGKDDDDDDDDDESSRPFWWGQEYFSRLTRLELHRRSFTKRLETGQEAQLRVENRNGRVSIRVHDQPAIVVEVQAELYADSASQADADAGRIERGISQEANRVSVVAPDLPRPEWFFFGRGPKIDYEILVPADTEVRANCRNGSVYISGTHRRARVESRNGKVTIENIAGDVEVEAKNGRITLESCASAKVIGVNGPISLEKVRGQIDVETRNGPIEMVDAGATVRARTTNGSVRFTGRVNGDIDMQAANGTIRLSVPVDSRFEIDAESVHGTTRSDLPVKEHPDSEATGPAPKVKLRTTNGSIRITGA